MIDRYNMSIHHPFSNSPPYSYTNTITKSRHSSWVLNWWENDVACSQHQHHWSPKIPCSHFAGEHHVISFFPLWHLCLFRVRQKGKIIIHPHLIAHHYSTWILFTKGQLTTPREMPRVLLHPHLAHFKSASLPAYASFPSSSSGDTTYRSSSS